MRREFSAGGIVFNNKNQVLLINNAAMRDPNKSYWGFPKGHIDPGEKSQDGAVREVKEETGLEVTVIDKIGDSKYVFQASGEKIFKVVIMFLMEVGNDQITIQQEELLDTAWFEPEEALEKISFSNDKALLKKALEIRNG